MKLLVEPDLFGACLFYRADCEERGVCFSLAGYSPSYQVSVRSGKYNLDFGIRLEPVNGDLTMLPWIILREP